MEFTPGFRLSKLDILALIIGAIVATIGYGYSGVLTFIVFFVTGHFFLFCNVIRMSRTLELIWAVTFLILASSSIVFGRPTWVITALASLSVTTILVVLEIKKPSYHGIFWQIANPNLREWYGENIDCN